MIPFIAAAGAKLLPVKSFLKSIPRPIWIAIGIGLALFAVVIWHKSKVDDAYDRGVSDEQARSAERAAKWKTEIDGLTGQISAKLREKSDEEIRIIYRDADALRVSGPGRSACPARIPGPSGRSEPASGGADVAGPQVPSGEWSAVPWNWLVDRAEQCDLNRSEVLTWREWYRQQSEAWAKAAKP